MLAPRQPFRADAHAEPTDFWPITVEGCSSPCSGHPRSLRDGIVPAPRVERTLRRPPVPTGGSGGDYRIDVLSDGELIEIQHGSLAAIRDKVARLLPDYRVLVVKPIVVRKHLVKQDSKGGRIISRRMSPKQGDILDLFHELVHFTVFFPTPISTWKSF